MRYATFVIVILSTVIVILSAAKDLASSDS